MAVLYFSGDQVAFYDQLNNLGGTATAFTGVVNPFLATDQIEIEITNSSLQANGEFSFSQINFTRITVIRDGVAHQFTFSSGTKVKESGGGGAPEQGDTFFTTTDQIYGPTTGPFAGIVPDKMVFSTSNTFATGQTTTITRVQSQDLNSDGDTTDSGEAGNGNFNATPAYTPPCFASGTMILTANGERPVECLNVGDMVSLYDGGTAAILWKGSRTKIFSSAPHPHKPIRIGAGGLGPRIPSRDLIVSPQHRILLAHPALRGLAAIPEGLARAKALLGLRNVRQKAGVAQITYHTILLARHGILIANGAAVESYYPGAYAFSTLTRTEQDQIARAIGAGTGPGTATEHGDAAAVYGPPARPILTARVVSKLVIAAKGDALQSGQTDMPAVQQAGMAA